MSSRDRSGAVVEALEARVLQSASEDLGAGTATLRGRILVVRSWAESTNVTSNITIALSGAEKDAIEVIIRRGAADPAADPAVARSDSFRFARPLVKRIRVFGGPGVDRVRIGEDPGWRVPAQILGGDGDDVLIGGAGRDHIHGGDGKDHLEGLSGADRLIGGTGDDEINTRKNGGRTERQDRITGGPGNDHIDYEPGMRILDRRGHHVVEDLEVGEGVEVTL